jgi:glycerol 2-dehydrogenase (NADP+)
MRVGSSFHGQGSTYQSALILYIDDNPAPLGADGSLKIDETCDFHDTWKEMEKVLASGKVRSIGVSNFSIKTSGVDSELAIWIQMTDCQGFRVAGWNNF